MIRHQLGRILVIILATALIIIGVWWGLRENRPTLSPPTMQTVSLYFGEPNSELLVVETRDMEEPVSVAEVVAALCAGPSTQSMLRSSTELSALGCRSRTRGSHRQF